MPTSPIALTELVKKLGYKEPQKLANKVRDILKEKEDFARFLVEDVKDKAREDARDEKQLVIHDSEILVDNIALLFGFSGLFGRAKTGDKSTYPAYQNLKKGTDEQSFKKKLQNQKNKLSGNIQKSKEALEALPLFGSAVLSQERIDITKDSLRDLMEKADPSALLHDFSNSFELGAWNALLELEERLENDGESSPIYQEIGERFIELGDDDQALEAFDNAIESEHTNGIAQAMKAMLLYRKIHALQEDWREAQVHTEFAGEIANPISAQEHWINERIADIRHDHASFRKQLIESAIQALLYWPTHAYNPDVNNPNYLSDLRQATSTSFELKRDTLFLILADFLDMEDMKKWHSDIEMIVRNFQRNDPDLYPLTTIYKYNTLQHRHTKNLIKVLCWISGTTKENAIKGLLNNIRQNLSGAQEDLDLVSDQFIQPLLVAHLGFEKYRDLLNTLFKKSTSNQEQSHAEHMATLQLEEVLTPLKLIIKTLEAKHDYFGDIPPWLEKYQVPEREVEKAFVSARNKANNWTMSFNEAVLDETGTYRNQVQCASALLCCLLELSVNHNVDHNADILNRLCLNANGIKGAVRKIDQPILAELVEQTYSINSSLESAFLVIKSEMAELLNELIEDC